MLFVTTFNISSIVQADTKSDEKELFLVAQKAFDDGFYDVAIRYIEQFLRDYPNSGKRTQAELLLGQCYFFKSHYLKAFDTFQKLLKYSEFKDATLFWLGETYFKGSDYSQAEKHYKRLIDMFPDSVYLPQAYYSLAWTYYDRSDLKVAKKIFLELIKKFPAHQLSEDATFKLGECEHNLGNYDIAREYFTNYIFKYQKSTRHAEAYFYIAEGYYYSNNFLEAVTYYAKAADIAYDHKLVYMSKVSMGWCYLKLDKYKLSQKYFDEAKLIAIDKNILSDDIYLGQANLYSKMEKNEEARDTYKEIISKFPNSPRITEAHLGKANIDYALKKYSEAITGYKWLIDKYAQNPFQQEILEKAYYGLAWTYLKSGDIDSSIQTFEAIMNKTESKIVKISALTQIGDAYHDINELEKAINIYDRILKNYPDSIYTDYIQFRQGIALLKSDKLEAATLSFKSLESNFPNSKYLLDVKYYLGIAYFKKEDGAEAIRYILAYLKKADRSESLISEANYILGLSYFNQKKYEEALKIFQKIIRNYPHQRNILYISELHIAKSLYNMGRIKEAIKKFKTIPIIYSDTEIAQDAILWLGDYYLETSQWDNAIRYYKQFLQNFPGSDRINLANYELGQVYQAMNDIKTALDYYNRINETSQNPDLYTKAKLTIAEILSEEVDIETTIKTYLHIADNSPNFKRDAYVKIAKIYIDNKNYTEAIATYNNALKAPKALNKSTDADIQFHIGDIYEILNDSEKAVESYLRIPYLYTEETQWIVKAYLRVARIFEDSGQWKQAQKTYGKILEYKTAETKYAQERLEWINGNIFNHIP